jgi:hypothetical protein
MMHPQSLKLVMDSLRYWITEMHVDGFRFDLAATLARELHDVDKLSAFFDIIHQDPVISQVKLIAEPWDIGEGGYQVGNFPVLWAEWNGRYRDTVRGYWHGEPGTVAELGYRLTGSSDLYESDGRRPHASINFIVAHDGFTLNDLVSYNEKHNEANGEGNRDGENHNRSYNFGVEGPTDDPEIRRQREKQKRNFLTTLLLSQGVPMICGGRRDGANAGREQQRLRSGQRDLLDQLGSDGGAAGAARLHPPARPSARGAPRLPPPPLLPGAPHSRLRAGRSHLAPPDGEEMTEEEWNTHFTRCFGMLLGGDAMLEWDEHGERVTDDTFLLLFNADGVPSPSLSHVAPPACGGAWCSAPAIPLYSWEIRSIPGHPDRPGGQIGDGALPLPRRGVMSAPWQLHIGAEPDGEGTRFRVWAGRPHRRGGFLGGKGRAVALQPSGDGYFAARVSGAVAGDRYRYRLDGGDAFPDPASRISRRACTDLRKSSTPAPILVG